MDIYIHSTIAMLAVINPVVCGTMAMQLEKGGSTKSNVIAGVKAMIVVLILLLVAALAGKFILNAFGISMDAFKVVGGIILSFIGFQMLAGPKPSNNGDNSQGGLTPLIMFAASPGTIAMTITLAAVHNPEGLPVSAMVGATFAVIITIAIMIAMQLMSGKVRGKGQGMVTRFMGLIIVSMGLQFMLDGVKHFFGL
jgi:multiple antibiotic resistance protein